MKTSGWYGELGLRPVINAAATLTSLGGSLMPAPVLESMADAAGSFVDIVELHDRVGSRLAELTHNEAGYVVSGAAAGITLAVAACIAGSDPHLVRAFPHLEGVKRREVVIEKPPTAHRSTLQLVLRRAVRLRFSDPPEPCLCR